MIMKLRGLLIVFFSVFLCACEPVIMPQISCYQLEDLKPPKIIKHPKTHLTLLVSSPIASPGYQTSAMVYVLTPYKLSAYANSRWVAEPTQMLMPLFVQVLRQTSHFFAVVSPPFTGITDYRLDTQLLKLQQEFFLPISQVRLIVQASLIKTTTNRIVGTGLFEVIIPAPTNNPYGGVLASNQAANILSRRIAQFCVAYAR